MIGKTQPIVLERSEVEHLIVYHREAELEAAGRQEYDDAIYHKRRGDELVKLSSQQPEKSVVDHAVDRFLGWKLPQDFSPDCGISFTPLGHPNCWPTGTNLLHAGQAKAMFEYCLAQQEQPAS
jgi:hypothetical protein